MKVGVTKAKKCAISVICCQTSKNVSNSSVRNKLKYAV